MHGETLGGPQVLAGLAEASFRGGGGARFQQALRDGGHFPRQRREQAEVRGIDLSYVVFMAHPQAAQALGKTDDGTHEEPAHHQERYAHDQDHERQGTPEALAPY